jgi:hypothetical protein
MRTMQATTTMHSARTALVSRALALGAKAGLIMAWLYLMGYYALFITSFGSFDRPNAFDGILMGTAYILLFGAILGMLPAMVIGMFTAWLIARCMHAFGESLSASKAIAIGVGICLVIAVLLSSFYGVVIAGVPLTTLFDDFLMMAMSSGYIMFLGFPSLIYVPTGGIVGYQLFRFWQRQSALNAGAK